MIQSLRIAEFLAESAMVAMIEEGELSPKPGLVDARSSGSHSDMDLEVMTMSAASLRNTFFTLAKAGVGQQPSLQLREEIGCIGRYGERTMLAATGGRNTHRGAIWIIGLLTVAAATLNPEEWSIRAICSIAGLLARTPDRHSELTASKGYLACRRFGVGGARAEARSGFPHLQRLGMPALLRSRRLGYPEDCSRLNALLAIMSNLDDTCILHRGSRPALWQAQIGAGLVLRHGGYGTSAGRHHLDMLDRLFISSNVSPGGSADLLAAVLFLDSIAKNASLRL